LVRQALYSIEHFAPDRPQRGEHLARALAVVHVPFEDLGSLGDELTAQGITVHSIDACTCDFESLEGLTPELVVVMGGPIGTYETGIYPFLSAEIAWLRERLEQRLPTLGICLGAQLMAAALGANVYPGNRGREIGWSTLKPGRDAADCPAMAELLAPAVPVLHWHGDTFDIPRGASHLAATDLYPAQAWSLGERILGLQFHPEVIADTLECWYVGHACELSAARIDVPQLRAAGRQLAPELYGAARRLWKRWLDTALS
jgi:GMP synthase (glutamine-hydrolysing)